MIDVVGAIIQNSQGEIFIARRKKGQNLEGYWEFPGGKIETDESPEEALIREIKEELDITIEVKKYIGEYIHRYKGGKIRLIVYQVIKVAGEIKLIDHDQYMWIDVHELKNIKLSPADVAIIPDLFELGY